MIESFRLPLTSPRLLDASVLERLILEKKVRRKWHPHYPHLALYKYAGGYDFNVMDDEAGFVEECRGLVYDHDKDRIVCRGLPKFYNHFRYPLPELEQLFCMDHEVQEKVDGSCALLWHYRGKWHFSTLGSFESEQAKEAQELFVQRCSYMIRDGILNPSHTYVFEVVYPGNQVILNYGMEEKLVYLCEFDNQTGKEYYTGEFECVGEGVEVAGGLTDHMTLEELIRSVKEDEFREGYVVRFDPGDNRPNIRVKFKTKWYFEHTAFYSRIRQHGLVKTLFEYYKAGREVPVSRDVVDEYVVSVHAGVERLVATVYQAVTGLGRIPTRKKQATHILELTVPSDLKSALFAGLDGKEDSVRFMAWKTLENERTDNVPCVVAGYEATLAGQQQWEGRGHG